MRLDRNDQINGGVGKYALLNLRKLATYSPGIFEETDITKSYPTARQVGCLYHNERETQTHWHIWGF